jgi:GxxExxY protein
LFEHVYETILAHELRKQHLHVARQVSVPIVYDGIEFEEGYRADLIVEQSIIVELKSVEAVLSVHWKQLFTQLKLKDFRLGLLINFGAEHLKNGICRIAKLTCKFRCVPSRLLRDTWNLRNQHCYPQRTEPLISTVPAKMPRAKVRNGTDPNAEHFIFRRDFGTPVFTLTSRDMLIEPFVAR